MDLEFIYELLYMIIILGNLILIVKILITHTILIITYLCFIAKLFSHGVFGHSVSLCIRPFGAS